MKRVYYLSTCDKCKRILSDVEDIDTYELIDIKQQPIVTSFTYITKSSDWRPLLKKECIQADNIFWFSNSHKPIKR